MAGITLEQAQAQLDKYIAAETKVLSGQRVEIDGQILWRADIEFIQKGIATWDARVKQLDSASNGRTRMRTVMPRW